MAERQGPQLGRRGSRRRKRAGWVESHLLALAGLAAREELGGNRRNEAFSAWRRFLEALAEQRPFVLVVEDLHWADESLLDFVDELVDWVTDVPLLVVAQRGRSSSRGDPAGAAGSSTRPPSRVTADERRDCTCCSAAPRNGRSRGGGSSDALLERAGGNPLYAEQFAELYVERGSAGPHPAGDPPGHHLRAPGRLRPARRASADASVVGKVFWTGALGSRRGARGASTHSRGRRSSPRTPNVGRGESEFAFAHALVRDVAYAQIPRADRAAKHRNAPNGSSRSVVRGPRGDACPPLALGTRARERSGIRTGDLASGRSVGCEQAIAPSR